MRRQVLEGLEALAEGPDVLGFRIEGPHRLREREVAGRPGAWAREVAREEPVRGPLAEATELDEPRLDLLVGKARKLLEVGRGRGEAGDVLGLAAREAERDQLLLARAGQPASRREGIGLLGTAAEALDQPVADREGCVQRDLLRGDRGDERLERVGRERGPEAGQRLRQAPQHRVAARPRVERLQVELGAEQLANDRPSLCVEWLDPHAAAGRLDPHLPPADHSVQRAVGPEVGEVGPEGAEALGRELEVEWLGKAEQAH